MRPAAEPATCRFWVNSQDLPQNTVEQITAGAILHHEEHVAAVVVAFVHPADVGVVQLLSAASCNTRTIKEDSMVLCSCRNTCRSTEHSSVLFEVHEAAKTDYGCSTRRTVCGEAKSSTTYCSPRSFMILTSCWKFCLMSPSSITWALAKEGS